MLHLVPFKSQEQPVACRWPWLRLLGFILLLSGLSGPRAWAAFGISQSYVILNPDGAGNRYLAGEANAAGAPAFQDYYAGSFKPGQTLTLGAELRTVETGPSTVTGARFYYRVYRTGTAPGAFSQTSPALATATAGGAAGSRQWTTATTAAGGSQLVDVLAGLSARGSYTLEGYWAAQAAGAADVVDDNAGQYYRATFDYLSTNLCGTYTINVTQASSATNFTTFSGAIGMLNSGGVSCATTFNVAAGTTYTELRLLLTATGTASSPIVFQKAGTGANPRIMPMAGGSTDLDAIVALQGSDYVTFNGIDLADAATNTNTLTAMEYGYALFRTSNTNGCQHVTIQNCTVTLNRLTLPTNASGYPIGIYSAFTTANSSSPLSTGGATAAGTNSDNAFYGNTIWGVQNGISLNALQSGASFYPDQNNDVGGSSAATGNSIINFGGLTASSAGVIMAGQNNSNVSYNTIDNTGGPPTLSSLNGIISYGATGGDYTFSHNTATLVHGAASTAEAYVLQTANTGTGTIRVQDNVLSLTTTASGSNSDSDRRLIVLSNGGTIGSVVASGNTLTMTLRSTAANSNVSKYAIGLYNGQTVTGALTLTDNKVAHVFASTGTSTISTLLLGIYNEGAVGGTATISNNALMYTGTATASSGPPTSQYQGITNVQSIGNGFSMVGNTLLNGSTASTSELSFIRTGGTVTGALAVSTNRFENVTAAGVVLGYLVQAGSSTGATTVTGNTALNLSSSSGLVTGLSVAAGGATISRNQVYTLKGTGTSGRGVRGLVLSGSGAANMLVYNNVIGDLTADGSGTAAPDNYLMGIGVLSGTGYRLYNNSVQLSGNRLANGLSSKVAAALYVGSGATGLDVRNNVLSNVQTTADATQPGTNYAVFAAGGSSPFTTSDYNLYNLRPPSSAPQHLGRLAGNDVTTLADWKTATGQDRSSMLALGNNAAGFTSATDLTPNPANATSYVLNGTGVQLTAVATDLAGAARPTTVPLGAPDLGAYEVTPNAGVLPPALEASAAPALGGTQTFSLNGRPLAALAYAAAGTAPTAMVVRYYSGTNPPAPFAAAAKYANVYFTFTPTGGSGYSYAPTLYYDPALLGTISSEAAQRLQLQKTGGYTTLATTVNAAATARTLNSSALIPAGASLLAIADAAATLPVRSADALAAGQAVAWPNPFGPALHLSLALPQAAPSATLTLADALGREVLRQELGALPAGPSQPTLPTEALRQLPPGVYVLQLALPTSTQVLKVVKD